MTDFPERPDCDFEQPTLERCAKESCRQLFYPDMAVKAVIHGVELRFCSEHCASAVAIDAYGIHHGEV